jgi:pentatricopeptide repeat protein
MVSAETWTAMIPVYTANNQPLEALKVLDHMKEDGFAPNHVTYLCLIQACTELDDPQRGKELHKMLLADSKVPITLPVHNALIKMYVKFKDWNAALGQYRAIYAYGWKPNAVTLSTLLATCAELGDLQTGKTLHEDIIAKQLPADVTVYNSLINMYMKCNELPTAFEVYQQMQKADLKPDAATYITLLNGCAQMADLTDGKQVHDDVTNSGIEVTTELQNALINMYLRCGDFKVASRVQQELQQRGVKPDETTFTYLLQIYAKEEDVDKAKEYRLVICNINALQVYTKA